MREESDSAMAQADQRCVARVSIDNKLGMHARPAMAFVDLANTFDARVTVRKGSQAVDGKSIMQMMMLAATKGTELEIETIGPDAEQALEELSALVKRKFDEE